VDTVHVQLLCDSSRYYVILAKRSRTLFVLCIVTFFSWNLETHRVIPHCPSELPFPESVFFGVFFAFLRADLVVYFDFCQLLLLLRYSASQKNIVSPSCHQHERLRG